MIVKDLPEWIETLLLIEAEAKLKVRRKMSQTACLKRD